MQPEYVLKCEQEPCPPAAAKILKAPAGQKHRWFQHDHLMLVEGTVRKPAAVASAAPDDDARPFAANPSIAAPRRSSVLQERESLLLFLVEVLSTRGKG